MKKNKLLLFATLVTIGATNAGMAADVSSWAGLKANSNEANIEFQSDITATGEANPMPINFSSSAPQTINGNYHSFSSDPYTGSGYYSLSINNTADLNIKNFGKYVDGTAGSNTFSYTDFNGNAKYVTIQGSVNSFDGYFLTIGKPITVSITNSVFANNGKDTNARLIYVSSAGVGTLNVKDSIFYNNSMANAGPVINGNKFDVNVDNTIFYGNKNAPAAGSTEGGAIYTAGGKATIKNSYFINNTAKNRASSSIKGKGGAIYISRGSGHVIENSRFEGNTSAEEGGAVYVYYNATTDYVKNSQFIGNTQTGADSYGGGGGLSFGGGYVRTIEQCLFESNRTATKGGGLYIEELSSSPSTNKVALVKDSIFKSNTADLGGGMYFSSDNAKFSARIVDPEFTSNSATKGGGLYITNGDVALISEINDVIFSGNTASDVGDDIYFMTNSYAATLFLNAADGKKISFDGTIAAAKKKATSPTPTIDINKTGVTYSTYAGDTETVHNAGTTGEIVFNNQVGDALGNVFNINLYGGKLTLGQDDSHLNDNNFYVKGDSTLSTVNNAIGQFAPSVFDIDAGVTMDYMFDVDLANTQSDTIALTNNNGTLRLSSFNVISDSDTADLKIKYSNTNVNGQVKDGYTITTSTNTYDVTASNDDTGSYVVFTMTGGGGGLPAAIKAEANQYIITNGQDENVTSWVGATGNVITSDIDINANGNSIFTENGIDGMVVSSGINAALRNTSNLSGFNNALTNNGGILSVIDSNISGNSGTADITNNSGSVIINAATSDINIGSSNTLYALSSNGGTVDVKGSKQVTFNGDVNGTGGATMNIATDTTFNGSVSNIDIAQSAGTVNLKALNINKYTLNDGTLNIDKTGSFSPTTFELNNGSVNIPDEAVFSPSANVLNGGSINAANGNIGNLNLNSLTLNGVINLAVDVDMGQQSMDKLSASSIAGSGTINVNQFNVLSEPDNPNIVIDFASGNLKDYITTNVQSIEGKIFKYNVGYNKETGQFSFSGGGSDASGFSPSIMSAPIAAEMGGFIAQSQVLQSGFHHMDNYTKLSSKQRFAAENANKYALVDSNPTYQREDIPETSKALWVVPYTSFESVDLKGGAKVRNITYGSLFGGDTDLVDIGHGFKRVISAFIGYDGAHQSYKGISSNQEGGVLGVTGTWYKGNFFTAITASVAASAGQAYTSFGTDHFAMLSAGIANKTGYNIELFDGRFIIQPQIYTGYVFTNPFDYRTSSGIKITSDPLNAIQVAPGVKFIGNLNNGLQVYAGVDVMMNFMGETKYRANETKLPELSVKPYVQYGVGVQKTWGDRFTGFFQTMIRNGGRNGVALQLGFRWTLGRSKPKTKNTTL